MSKRPTRWYRRLVALAELAGDHQQQDIAAALGVSKSTVTDWKKGTPPSPETIMAAFKAYDFDPHEQFDLAYIAEGSENRDPKGATITKTKTAPKRRTSIGLRADAPTAYP